MYRSRQLQNRDAGLQSRAEALLQTLESDSQSVEFRQPVDYIGLGLIDYPSIIKHPMDLSTVKKKLKAGKYQNVDQFMADVQLIWTNCKTYNQPDSIIYGMAEYLEKLTNKVATKLKLIPGAEDSEDTKEADPNKPSFDDKFAFIEKVKKLPPETMSELLKDLREICPKAVYSKDKRIQVKLDTLDKDELATLNEKVDEIIIGKSEAQSSEDRSEAISNKDESDT